ncbi:hypothetical protein NDU88_003232 [Pleurodeles waltl]|uniref:Uncharacterized protein n=1 Tax=Pleurodeles waltl TaxID=8319 RepID=A0AAV7MV10_PLEWA|nr:hypothetical protein NDU88_003232 [Pleurodeles waltl]
MNGSNDTWWYCAGKPPSEYDIRPMLNITFGKLERSVPGQHRRVNTLVPVEAVEEALESEEPPLAPDQDTPVTSENSQDSKATLD